MRGSGHIRRAGPTLLNDGSSVKQILQNLRSGVTEVADVPAPAARAGHVLIRTERTLVSAGTERMLVEFGRAGWLDKARQQPDKVRQVLDKIRTDGIRPTFDAVMNKLDQPLPLGYCNVGVVLETGDDVTGFAPGDRVVSNGRHAEVVSVPRNLVAKVPQGVSSDAAAFTVIGAIALQGIRLVQPTLGETVVVTGLGLIGLMTVQLLRAHGCRVLGLDFDSEKLTLARRFGADVVNLGANEDPLTAAATFSRGRGVDAVIITAATSSNEPVHQAALMCRKRGRIVLVGTTGLELSRADFFEKELTFQVSCSYGPGRYDPQYEEKGFDYPVGFVRWTEQRNFEAVLDMLASGRISVDLLVSHRIPIAEAERAYELVGGSAPSLGIVLQYPAPVERSDAELRQPTITLNGAQPKVARAGQAAVAFFGAGSYATGMLIPAFRDAGASLATVVSSAGVSGLHAARKFGFAKTTTDGDVAFDDPAANTVVVATRHDSHASLVIRGLGAGKHVFVEKPLALTLEQVDQISAAAAASDTGGRGPLLMIGFNRRFAPDVVRARELLAGVAGPRTFQMTVNAGALPDSHWLNDPKSGGGRILGEACHFVDLLRHLAGSPIASFDAVRLGRASSAQIAPDQAAITLRFADGSVGTILYVANGHKSFPKERLEIFAAGRVLQLDNYRRLAGYGWPGFSSQKRWSQDKGQSACAAAFVRAVTQGTAAPIPLEEILEVSRVTIEIAAHLASGG